MLLLHRRTGLTRPKRWAIAGPRLSPPRPVALKPQNSLRQSVGPTHACQTAPSEHVNPPGLPHKLLLGTSSRQISNAYLGGNLSLAAVLHYIVFGGTLGSGPSRAQSPPPGQHAYNVLPYSPNTHYVYRASRCKCEIVKHRIGVLRSSKEVILCN